MPDENIDYEAVVKELQHENERLRSQLAHIMLRNPLLDFLKWENIKHLVLSPYFIAGYIVGAIATMFFSWFVLLKEIPS